MLAEAILESIIGKHGVSPAAKRSLATRLIELIKGRDETINGKPESEKLDEII